MLLNILIKQDIFLKYTPLRMSYHAIETSWEDKFSEKPIQEIKKLINSESSLRCIFDKSKIE